MRNPEHLSIAAVAPAARSGVSYGWVSMAGDVLPLLDLAVVLLVAWLGGWLQRRGAAVPAAAVLTPVAWLAVMLAPVLLYDKAFAALAGRAAVAGLVRAHAQRVALWVAAVLALGALSQEMRQTAPAALLWLFGAALVLTTLMRTVLARSVQRLQRRGLLSEVIAVVGAGAVADRLVQVLGLRRPGTVELLGIFDDAPGPGAAVPSGTLAQLIELGQRRRIDWIVLTLPPTDEESLRTVVRQLKALSVPIGLCPQHVGLTQPCRITDVIGGSVPVSLLADRPIKRWHAVVAAAEALMPRWITTLAVLPFVAADTWRPRRGEAAPIATPRPARRMRLAFDPYDAAAFADQAAGFGQDEYGFVVTPNADHLIRLEDDAAFRDHYAAARFVLLDSRFLAHVVRATHRMRLPVCTGSDLTEKLLTDVIVPDDALVLVGGSDAQAQQLRERHGLRRLAHVNPPMGFIHDPVAVEACLHFIESHSPFRFCLLALGAPQQEAIAHRLKSRGVARGLALCIGASINFLTGLERRAPSWMQRAGLEWSYRLWQAPRRMAGRYLVRGPRVFGLLRRAHIALRNPTSIAASALPAGLQPAAIVEAVATVEPTLAEQHQRLVVVVAARALPGAQRVDALPLQLQRRRVRQRVQERQQRG